MVTNLSARERNDSQARFNVYPLETDNLCAITAPSNVSLFSFFLSLSLSLSIVIEKCLYFSLRRLSRDL